MKTIITSIVLLLALCGCCLFHPTPTPQAVTPQLPPAPSTLVVYSSSDRSVKFNWDFVVWETNNIDYFRILWGTSSMDVGRDVSYIVNPIAVCQGVVPSLNVGQTYRFTCVAVKNGVASKPSSEVTFTVP